MIFTPVDGYGVEDMLYEWTHGPDGSIKMASDMRLSQFDLIAFPAGNETVIQYRGKFMYARSGVYMFRQA